MSDARFVEDADCLLVDHGQAGVTPAFVFVQRHLIGERPGHTSVRTYLYGDMVALELPHYEMGFEAVRQLVAMLDGDKAVADLESDHGMAVQRQRDGGKTALRCRIIERDSIVL